MIIPRKTAPDLEDFGWFSIPYYLAIEDWSRLPVARAAATKFKLLASVLAWSQEDGKDYDELDERQCD